MTDNIYEIESGYIPPIRHEFAGDYNDNQERTGEGCQIWNGIYQQKYTGTFLHNNLHGKGQYIELNKSKSYLYEGTFYANDFEGYSNVTFLNGDYFEGLFKHNRRFGPGTYTYSDGTQNVGLWYGDQLMRLSCVVLGEWVPKLARSSTAKTKLLKYRKLVPIRQEYEDIAKDILVKLNARPEVIANSDKLYNPSVRNINSLFFNRKSYDKEFYGEIDCTIDVAVDNGARDSDSSSTLSAITVETPGDIVKNILDYLLENVDIVESFPEHQRRELVYESILTARKEVNIESDTVEVKKILDEFMAELDKLFTMSEDERKLVVNKKTVRKKLPVCDKPKTDYAVKKVSVTDLLAWNNEEISIEMMLQVFAHRNKEHSVSFSIAKLLAGDRSCFNAPGEMETNCVSFLNFCSSGDANGLINVLKENGLNADLCDARGNSGIIFAAARDNWNIIKLLCDVGANLDMVNDEGLTALGICILRYIALRNDIKDWERAFLPDALVTPEEEMQVKQWHPHASLTNLSLMNAAVDREPASAEGDPDLGFLGHCNKIGRAFKSIDVEGSSNTAVYEELINLEIDMIFKAFQKPYLETIDTKQKYILNIKCMPAGTSGKLSAKPKLNKVSEKESSLSTPRSKLSFTRKQSKRSTLDVLSFIKENKLKVIFNTIKVLLGCGADANLSYVPLPVLLLAVFSADLQLFNLILESNPDPNIVSEDEGVTALHMIAALPFTRDHLEMFKLLLKNGADPNIRTSVYHWVEEKEKILGKHEASEEHLGKTAMHILSMRYDFPFNEKIQQEMVELLIEHGGHLDDLYLGHEPFTLAILRANLTLIRFYLDSGQVDPYKVLGEGMGVATTILILKRYANILPVDRCKGVYDLFVEKNVNPLVEFENYGNAIEFMDTEYEATSRIFRDTRKEAIRQNKSHAKSRSSKLKSNSVSSKKHKKSSPIEEVKNYLLECTRRILQRHIQYKAFKYLKRLIMQNVDLDDEVLVILVKFLPIKDLVNLMQLLIHRGIILPKDSYFYVMLTMLQLSKKYSKIKMKRPRPSEISSLSPPLIVKVLNWMADDQEPIIHFNMIEPELDALTDKYIVCFHCCKRTNKDLIACPNCGLVYFCSEECNKLSNRHPTVHKCNILFYDKEKKARDNALANGLEYNNTSKLQGVLDHLDDLLRQQFGINFSALGISPEDFDFDKMASHIFQKLAESDPTILAKVEKGLKEANLAGFQHHVQKMKDFRANRKAGKGDDSEYQIGSGLFGYLTRKKSKDSRNDCKIKKDGKIGVGKRKLEKGKGSKHTKKSGKKSDEKFSRNKGKGKKDEKSSSRSSGKSSTKSKHGKDRSKSKGSKGSKTKTLETIFRRDKSKGKYSKGDKSSKNAVYKQHIAKSDYTRSRKDKYEQEQARLREKYKDQQAILGGLLGDAGKYGYETAFEQLARTCARLPNKCQFFLEKLSELFPDVDISALFWPYVCYVDGQLYYRFLEARPIFMETYSSV